MVFGGLFTRRTSCCWLWEKWWEGVTDTPSCLHDSVGVITAMGLITFRPNPCLKTCCLLLLITHKCWKKIEMQGWSICLLCFCICHVHERERIYAGMFTICHLFKLLTPSCRYCVVWSLLHSVDWRLLLPSFSAAQVFLTAQYSLCFFFIPQNTHSFKMLVSQSS